MDPLDLVGFIISSAHSARNNLQLNEAIYHFNHALAIVSGYNKPGPFADVLLGRAEVYMILGKYNEAVRDITRAVKCPPFTPGNDIEASVWLQHAEENSMHAVVQLHCYSAALHHANGNNVLKSLIYGRRAFIYHNLGQFQQCDNDVKNCQENHAETAMELGIKNKENGIQLYQLNNLKKSILALQFAEKLLKTFSDQVKEHLHDCFTFMSSALWKLKQYDRAIDVGNECFKLKSGENKKEVAKWKSRGNDMVSDHKYGNAVKCYTLAIEYIPVESNDLLAILYSNRSHAYLKDKQFYKSKDDAEKCLTHRPKWTKSYFRLCSALFELQQYNKAIGIWQRGLNIPQTQDEQNDLFGKIIEIFNCRDGAMKISFELPQKCLDLFIKKQVESKNWKMIEFLFLGGGGQHSYAEGEGGLATGCNVSYLSLNGIIESQNEIKDLQKLLKVLIDHGCPVNGLTQVSPLSVAVNKKDFESALVLLENGADVIGLMRSKMGRLDDAHVCITAFRIGLSSRFWKIFCFLMDQYGSENPDFNSEVKDKNGNSLYHCFAEERMSFESAKEVLDLMKKYNVDPTARNKNGKTPLSLVRVKDDRVRLIEEHMNVFQSQQTNSKKTKKKKKKKKNRNKEAFPIFLPDENIAKVLSETPVVVNDTINTEENVAEKENETTVLRTKSELDIIRENISILIDKVDVDLDDSLNEPAEESGNENKESSSVFNENELSDPLSTDVPDLNENKQPLPTYQFNFENYPEPEEVEVDDMLFDNLTWEVECTSEVWKILKNKRLSSELKKRIVKIIHQLARGEMRGSLAKPLEGLPKQNNILLFEAKLSRGARILWERAIAFSPRCSNNPELLTGVNQDGSGKIYSEIIRIWDIVFDHDTVPRKIEKIIQSHKRGSSCIIKKELKGFDPKLCYPAAGKDHLSIPKLYTHKDDLVKQRKLQPFPRTLESNEVATMFCPPGCPEETEYHILKFYAFSNALVNTVLNSSGKINVDFPFRVSELEHAVINLNPESSLLLLGRSGTGKTTCCLYRLWCNFQTYWNNRNMDEPGFPNTAQFLPIINENDTTSDNEERQQTNEDDECTSEVPRNGLAFDNKLDEAKKAEASCNEELRNTDPTSSCERGPTYEHLHQAFITKNAVLCTEVKKNFLELSHACQGTNNQSELSSSVNRLEQLGEQEWPLFVCSRDWLLMLDASLPEPAFFPRNEEGDLLRSVKGWGEEDNHLRLIDETNFEEDDEYELSTIDNNEVDSSQESSQMDPRLEVTYQVFKNELWPKMTKKRKVDYHPTLVWTEICSFIKGSVEALHSEKGYISLEDYQTLGRKRAPSFSADRETVYELFMSYQRVKYSRGMFDEADLIYHIFHRLQGNVPQWSIHEIFVDETQDFTQAELSVIIRCCRDPNRLFFTGDTAQSIMRGVAFRFNDLKSLFFYMKESYKAVGHQSQVRVPDRVYQLTHNYRSHSGILNLASSVIDLLVHFFPESFDRMERDQGLFQGPKPVLLESCSFSDLAVILRGHQRKTTPIEFGAHQVVLVASDDVRDSLPEELSLALVMTIYEAKGLEFDDVLIYNFFKDSQAGKEWRVVGGYKKVDDGNIVSDTGIVEINEDLLEIKTRPLDFDSDRHKILISEFKYLYTALTRARVNVWLFDEDEDARAPMFEYFQQCGVVDVKRPNDMDEHKLSGMFAEKSTEEEWRKQGHFFYGKDLWKVAVQCFTMAKDNEMVRKCNAQLQAAKAQSMATEPRKMRLEFLKAAELFLLCGLKDKAAICLHNAKSQLLLAKLYQKCGDFRKAGRLFRKEKKFREASENFEKSLDFKRAVDCLLHINCYDHALNVVARCQMILQNEDIPPIVSKLRHDQRNESICYQAAEYYLKRDELELMTSALEKLPETKDRLTFLLKNGCNEQAAKLLLKEGKYQEAAEMMRSNGEFSKAAHFTKDDKFAAECHLLEARSAILLTQNENYVDREEVKKHIDESLQKSAELYKKCNDINGQAEVKLVLGELHRSLQDVEEAAKLFFRCFNYVGNAECFLLLYIELGSDRRPDFPRRASLTVKSIFNLILALHKKKKENINHTIVAMCETYFGLVNTGDSLTRKVPQLEMARYCSLQVAKQSSEVNVNEAHSVIKERVYNIAIKLVKEIWRIHEKIGQSYKPCFRHLSGVVCEKGTCTYYHGDLTREHFAAQFYALGFLIHLDGIIAAFLKELRKESSKDTSRFREEISTPFRFKACRWLQELLFPKSGQLGVSYALRADDIRFLREDLFIRNRIKEYAMSTMWLNAKQEDKWSDSDLFITVSNLMALAGAPSSEVVSALATEERKFEQKKKGKPKDWYGFFEDRRKPPGSQVTIFSSRLELSKYRLYKYGDIRGATHLAVKEFLFTSARRPSMPYPSIANALMILEYYMTTCLILYSRFTKNINCFPESYLLLVSFWDLVHSKPNQIPMLALIQRDTPSLNMEDNIRKLQRLLHLTEAMVNLMFGNVSKQYNIFKDALYGKSSIEAERTLVLSLTMLCNCGRGIPQSCEYTIREQFLMFRLSSRVYLPDKLKQCIETVQQSQGVSDVVIALNKLLNENPRRERLLDSNWDVYHGKEFSRSCQPDRYPKTFHYKMDISEFSQEPEASNAEGDKMNEVDDDDVDVLMGNDQQLFDEDEPYNRKGKIDENEKKDACLKIENAVILWLHRMRAARKIEEKIKNDPVEEYFQSFKLDNSGCTICGNTQFAKLSDTSTSFSPASPTHIEEPNDKNQLKAFNIHCAKGAPHWKKEVEFKQFKEFYRKEILTTFERAQQVLYEMKELKNKTVVKCSLDLNRLEDAVSRLKQNLKKVKAEHAWDNSYSIKTAIDAVIKEMNNVRNYEGNVRAVNVKKKTFSSRVDLEEDSDYDDDDGIHHLKDVNTKKNGKRNTRNKRKRK